MPPKLIIRNASYFPPLKDSSHIPTISLLQDIMEDGDGRKMQDEVIDGSAHVVFNSEYTASKYAPTTTPNSVIPLPVDFSLFEPGNAMGLQQSLGLPDGCILWIGACQQAAQVKGWDTFIRIVRANPDLHFVAILKDAMPPYMPPNMRCYVRVPQEELVRIMGACRVGLCTSRVETQHLAGIEMGACGLPIVAPPVGAYYGRTDLAGVLVDNPEDIPVYTAALRSVISRSFNPDVVRSYWQKDYDRPVIRAAWEKLVSEVECSGQS